MPETFPPNTHADISAATLPNTIFVIINYLTFLIYMLSVVTMSAGEPFCDIRNYDERDGLSQRLVKQVVQDDNGVLWVATWNGLNRFDGYEFKCIRRASTTGCAATPHA